MSSSERAILGGLDEVPEPRNLHHAKIAHTQSSDSQYYSGDTRRAHTLYDLILKDIELQLGDLKNKHQPHYKVLEDAWRHARNWMATGIPPSSRKPILVPYVGSGLNRLAEGGIGSWEDLVKEVAGQCQKIGSDHQIRRSGLTMPQQLDGTGERKGWT